MVNIERAPLIFGPEWTAGDERTPVGVISWGDATPSTSAAVVAWPFFTGKPLVLAGVNMGLTTAQAGAEAMAGVYSDSGGGRPNTLIQDLGVLDLSATTGKRTWAATCTVYGKFWVLVWLKNVATQVTVRSPNTNSVSLVYRIASTDLVSVSAGPRALWVLAAYPASMPATAPAVAPNATAALVLVSVTAA